MTRQLEGQSVTFMHRYDQSVVQPALDNIDARLDAVDNRLGVVDTIRQSPERVVWVADDDSGDYSTLSQALASITDASESNPYGADRPRGVRRNITSCAEISR